MAFAFKPHQTVVFIGDSITDCGWRAEAAPLGNGYVRMISDLIDARYSGHQIKVINTGIGGNTVRELTVRFYDDAIRHQPDWMSILIGINDLHRCLGGAAEDVSVTPPQYAQMYDALLKRVKSETRAKIVLMDPFYISTERHPDSFRSTVLKNIGKYTKTVHAMASKYKTRHVKTHDLFQRALKCFPPDRFCPEPVHPYPSGHMLMAQAWLGTVGY